MKPSAPKNSETQHKKKNHNVTRDLPRQKSFSSSYAVHKKNIKWHWKRTKQKKKQQTKVNLNKNFTLFKKRKKCWEKPFKKMNKFNFDDKHTHTNTYIYIYIYRKRGKLFGIFTVNVIWNWVWFIAKYVRKRTFQVLRKNCAISEGLEFKRKIKWKLFGKMCPSHSIWMIIDLWWICWCLGVYFSMLQHKQKAFQCSLNVGDWLFAYAIKHNSIRNSLKWNGFLKRIQCFSNKFPWKPS